MTMRAWESAASMMAFIAGAPSRCRRRLFGNGLDLLAVDDELLADGDEGRASRQVGEPDALRSEERRVGKECVSPCRSRGSPDHQTKNNTNKILQTYMKNN